MRLLRTHSTEELLKAPVVAGLGVLRLQPPICTASRMVPLRMTGAAWVSALLLHSLRLADAASIPERTACRAGLPSGAQKLFHIRTTKLFPFPAGDRNPDILFVPFLRGRGVRESGPCHWPLHRHGALR